MQNKYSSPGDLGRSNSYYLSQNTHSSNQSLWSSLVSGKIFGNGDSRQPISFQDRSCFPLFASNSINPTFSRTPIEISTFGGNSSSKSMLSGSHNYTNSPNNNFSNGERMHESQIVNQNKQVHESSFFPLFTATNTRVQTPKDLYFSHPPSTYNYPRRESDQFPRREPRMPQSLLEQMLSGEIFRGNPNQNQTVNQCNRLYTEMPPTNPYTTQASNVFQCPAQQNNFKTPPVQIQPGNHWSPLLISNKEFNRISKIIHSNRIYESLIELDKLLKMRHERSLQNNVTFR